MAEHTKFGDLLRAARTAQGLTFEELESRSGVYRRNIQYLEKGVTNPNLRTLMLLAAGLGANLKIDFEFDPETK
jgi:transcriptional regulator with XRE-family HTH domain